MFQRVIASGLGRLDRATQAPRRRAGESAFWGREPSRIDNAISAFYFSVSARVWNDRGDTRRHVEPFVAGLGTVRSPTRILDLGTGTGASAAAAAARFPQARVDGFDRSKRAIRLAREKYEAGNLTFHVADFADLPFRTGTFDLVCMLNSTPHPTELNRVATARAQVMAASSFFTTPPQAWFDRWQEIGYERVAMGSAGKGHWYLLERRPT